MEVSIGRVTTKIMEAWARGGRSTYRYRSAEQMLEVILNRKRSVAAGRNSMSSFLWCDVEDDSGEPYVVWDTGMLPTVWVSKDGGPTHTAICNLPAYEAENDMLNYNLLEQYSYKLSLPMVKWLLENGLWIGDRFLAEVYISHCSSYDHYSGATEYDTDVEIDILMIERNHTDAILCDYLDMLYEPERPFFLGGAL